MTNEDKGSTILRNGVRRGRRWYPHEALERVAEHLGATGSGTAGLPWELLDPADAARHLPALRKGLTETHRFVAMIEAIAEGRGPAKCTVCSSQFYPSRSDAEYCSGRCRQAAHRARVDR